VPSADTRNLGAAARAHAPQMHRPAPNTISKKSHALSQGWESASPPPPRSAFVLHRCNVWPTRPVGEGNAAESRANVAEHRKPWPEVPVHWKPGRTKRTQARALSLIWMHQDGHLLPRCRLPGTRRIAFASGLPCATGGSRGEGVCLGQTMCLRRCLPTRDTLELFWHVLRRFVTRARQRRWW